MRIVTRRFLLRDFVATDESAYRALHTDARGRAHRSAESLTQAHAHQIFGLFREWANEHPRRNYQLAVCHRAQPARLVGTGGIRTRGCDPGVAELGVALAWEFHGRYRYAAEIMEAMMTFGFCTLELSEIRGITAATNTTANRLAEHYGFTPTPQPDAADIPQIEWRLARATWERLPWARHCL